VKKTKKSKQGKVHPELGGLDVEVTKFGEIGGTLDIDKLNSFLNRNVDDKKLSEDQIKPEAR
jgi:hypothetical protein